MGVQHEHRLIAGIGGAVHIEVAQAVLFGGIAPANMLCRCLDSLVLKAGSASGVGKVGDHLECFLIYFDSHKNSPFIFLMEPLGFLELILADGA